MDEDFGTMDSLVQGYQAAQVILTANRLGLFECIGKEARSSDDICAALGTDPRGTRVLCDALVSLSILEKSRGFYRNGSKAKRFLLPDSPESRVASLRHSAVQCEKWRGLFQSVFSGRPTPEECIDSDLRKGPREFAAAMADVGRLSARETVEKLDLQGSERMLDVGGGPGVYAATFAKRWPLLRVDILDDPETLEVAREKSAALGVADRIEFLAGDVFEMRLERRYDLVFLSNFVHIYPFQRNAQLIQKCAGALRDGGRVCIKDFILTPDRTAPQGAALFAVNMLVSTDSGDCYTEQEVISWFEGAGLRFHGSLELTRQSRLLIASKGPSGQTDGGANFDRTSRHGIPKGAPLESI